MASTQQFTATPRASDIPHQVSLPSAANQLFPGGTLITVNATDQAVSPSTADASGFPAVAVAESTQDNRTASELGGAAGALTIHGKCGVYGFAFTGSTPICGQKLYVVDNQTVSVAKNTTRGFAGICSEVRTLADGVPRAFFRVGPDVAGLAGLPA